MERWVQEPAREGPWTSLTAFATTTYTSLGREPIQYKKARQGDSSRSRHWDGESESL